MILDRQDDLQFPARRFVHIERSGCFHGALSSHTHGDVVLLQSANERFPLTERPESAGKPVDQDVRVGVLVEVKDARSIISFVEDRDAHAEGLDPAGEADDASRASEVDSSCATHDLGGIDPHTATSVFTHAHGVFLARSSSSEEVVIVHASSSPGLLFDDDQTGRTRHLTGRFLTKKHNIASRHGCIIQSNGIPTDVHKPIA